MSKYLVILILTMVTFLGAGCRNECSPNSGEMTCDGNRLMFCSGNNTIGEWDIRMDCSEYNATCQKAEIHFYGLNQSSKHDPWNYSHGCVTDAMDCTGGTKHQHRCLGDDTYVAACSYTPEPAAVIIGTNVYDRPYCFEKADGTADFAFAEGDCRRNESVCIDTDSYVECRNDVWGHISDSDYCSSYVQNLKCRTILQIDSDTMFHPDTDSSTDSETDSYTDLDLDTIEIPSESTFRTAECVDAAPCNEETGEYSVCAGENAVYICSDSPELGWRWGYGECYWAETCVTQDNGEGDCE